MMKSRTAVRHSSLSHTSWLRFMRQAYAHARRRSLRVMPASILLVSGSLRSGSTNTAVLRTASAVAAAGITTVLYDGLDRLPHFNPDDDHDPLDPAVAV